VGDAAGDGVRQAEAIDDDGVVESGEQVDQLEAAPGAFHHRDVFDGGGLDQATDLGGHGEAHAVVRDHRVAEAENGDAWRGHLFHGRRKAGRLRRWVFRKSVQSRTGIRIGENVH
jgi:hypothetical protein